MHFESSAIDHAFQSESILRGATNFFFAFTITISHIVVLMSKQKRFLGLRAK